MIYHITSDVAWQAAWEQGVYRGDTLETDGFIHCSSAHQVAEVANRYFPGRMDLVLLAIAPEKLTASVKWENLEGGEELFPHIYGELNLDAVEGVEVFVPQEDGKFHFS